MAQALGSAEVSLEQLSERYAEHNRVERGAGFIFAGPERVELFRRYVGGPGRAVLDLGCRDGALTQAYAGGNEIVGVDADREALAEAQKLGIETRWADLDDALPFEDGTFAILGASSPRCCAFCGPAARSSPRCRTPTV